MVFKREESMARKKRAGRNRNGVGGVRRLRPDLWQSSIQLKPGDRRYVSGKTREEAERKLTELRILRDQGRLPESTKERVRDYLAAWLRDDVKPTVAPRTYENYELNVRRLEPHIGSIHLDALKPDHIKAAYRALTEQGLAPRSVQQVHRTLRAALRQAVRSEHLYRDPTFGVSPPRAPEREVVVLTADQVRVMLTTALQDRLSPLWVLFVTTGLRHGESLGLQWRDIDLDGEMLSVRRQVQPLRGQGLVLLELKTAASRRDIPLVRGTALALRRHRVKQRAEFLALGIPWHDGVQVFCNADGGLLAPGSITKAFHRLLARADLPRVRVHDLRHMVSSFLQSRGRTDREVQEILGHASVNTTRLIYTHVMPNRRKDIMGPMEELFPLETDAV
jgi:integrase